MNMIILVVLIIGSIITPVSPCQREFMTIDYLTGNFCVVPEKSACWCQYGQVIYIIGHNPGIFSDLHLVEVGDIITFANREYEVTEVNILGEHEHSKFTKILSGSDLVLVTCLGNDKRLVVSGNKH